MEKQQNISTEEMHLVLLQTIVDKLEEQEMLINAFVGQKQNIDLSGIISQVSAYRKDVQAVFSKHTSNTNIISELNQNLLKLQRQLLTPIHSKIEHKHHLHKGVWISVGLALTLILLAAGWIRTFQNLNDYKENSIKYRYLKVFGNERVLNLCRQTDSLYDKDSEVFTDAAIQEERRILRFADSIRLAGERKKVKPVAGIKVKQ